MGKGLIVPVYRHLFSSYTNQEFVTVSVARPPCRPVIHEPELDFDPAGSPLRNLTHLKSSRTTTWAIPCVTDTLMQRREREGGRGVESWTGHYAEKKRALGQTEKGRLHVTGCVIEICCRQLVRGFHNIMESGGISGLMERYLGHILLLVVALYVSGHEGALSLTP